MTITMHSLANRHNSLNINDEICQNHDPLKTQSALIENSQKISLYNLFLENNLINENALLKESHILLPEMKTSQKLALKTFLKENIIFSKKNLNVLPSYKIPPLFEHLKKIHYYCAHHNVICPFEMKNNNIAFNTNCNLMDLFKFLLSENPSIESIEHYGGALTTFLGKKYYQECINNIINHEINLSDSINEIINPQPNDYDFRIFVPNVSEEILIKIEKDINLFFLSNFAQNFNFHLILESFIFVLNEIIYTKKARIQRYEKNIRDDYILKSFGIGKKSIDLCIIRNITYKELFSTHGLFLKLNDFIIHGESALLRPEGTLSFGWQSVFDKICKIITVTNDEFIYYEGWEKLIVFLTKGYWLPNVKIHKTNLHTILNQDLSITIKSVIKNLKQHHNDQKNSIFIGLLNAAIQLSPFISIQEMITFWNISFNEINGLKSDHWELQFITILKNGYASFNEMIELMNYIILIMNQTHNIIEIEYKNNVGEKYFQIKISNFSYLHIPKVFNIEDYNRIALLSKDSKKINLFIFSFCNNLIENSKFQINKIDKHLNEDIFDLNPLISFWLSIHTPVHLFYPIALYQGIKLIKQKPPFYITGFIFKILSMFHSKIVRKNLFKNIYVCIQDHILKLLNETPYQKVIEAKDIFIFFFKKKIEVGNHIISISKKLKYCHLTGFLKDIAIYSDASNSHLLTALKIYFEKNDFSELKLKEYLDLIFLFKKLNKTLTSLIPEFSNITFVNLFTKSLDFEFFDENWNLLNQIISLIPHENELKNIASKFLRKASNENIFHLWLDAESKGTFDSFQCNEHDAFIVNLLNTYIIEGNDLSIFFKTKIHLSLKLKKICKNAIKIRIEQKKIMKENTFSELKFVEYINAKKLLINFKEEFFINNIKNNKLIQAAEDLIFILKNSENTVKFIEIILLFFDSLTQNNIDSSLEHNIDKIINEINFLGNNTDLKKIYLLLIKKNLKNTDLYLNKLLSTLSFHDFEIIDELYLILMNKIIEKTFKNLNTTFIQNIKTKSFTILSSLYQQNKLEKVLLFFDLIDVSLFQFENSKLNLIFFKACLKILGNENLEKKYNRLIINNINSIIKKELKNEKEKILLFEICEKLIPTIDGILIKRFIFLLENLIQFTDQRSQLESMLKALSHILLEKKEIENLIIIYHLATKINFNEEYFAQKLFDTLNLENENNHKLEIISLTYQYFYQKDFFLSKLTEITLKMCQDKENLNELVSLLLEFQIKDIAIWKEILVNSNQIWNDLFYRFLLNCEFFDANENVFSFWKIFFSKQELNINLFFETIIPQLELLNTNQFLYRFHEFDSKCCHLFFSYFQAFLKNKNTFNDQIIRDLILFKNNFESLFHSEFLSVIELLIIQNSFVTKCIHCYLEAGNIILKKQLNDATICLNYILNGSENDSVIDLSCLMLNHCFDLFYNDLSFCLEIYQKCQNYTNVKVLQILAKHLPVLVNLKNFKSTPYITSILIAIAKNLEINEVVSLLTQAKIFALYHKQIKSNILSIILERSFAAVYKNELEASFAISITLEYLKYLIPYKENFMEIFYNFLELLLYEESKNISQISIKKIFIKIDSMFFEEKFDLLYLNKNQILKSRCKKLKKEILFYKNKHFLLLNSFVIKILNENIPENPFERIKFLHFAFIELIENYSHELDKTISFLEQYFWYSLKCKNEIYIDLIQDHVLFLFLKIKKIKTFSLNDSILRCFTMIKIGGIDKTISKKDIQSFYKKLIEEIEKHKNPFAILSGLMFVTYLAIKINIERDLMIKQYEILYEMIDFNPYLEINLINYSKELIIEKKENKIDITQFSKIFRFFEKRSISIDKSIPLFEKKTFLNSISELTLENLKFTRLNTQYLDKVLKCFFKLMIKLDKKYPLKNDAEFNKYNIPKILYEFMNRSISYDIFFYEPTAYFLSLVTIRKSIFRNRQFYNENFNINFYDELFFKNINVNNDHITLLPITRINILQEYLLYLYNNENLEDKEKAKKLFERALSLNYYEMEARLSEKFQEILKKDSK